jgi:hypothetical protein
MQILIDGVWQDGGEDWPVTVAYDPSMTTSPSALGYNRGCPPGYVAQAVAPERSWWGTTSGDATMVCRRADDQYVNNPSQIAAESGPDAVDASIQAVADASATVVEAAGQAASFSLTTLAPWLIGGLVAYMLLGRGIDKVFGGR